MHTASRIAALCIAVVVGSCATFRAQTSPGAVTRDEARRLASTYTLFHVAGCGGIEEPVAREGYWEVPLRVGVVGAREGAVRVHMRTGKVSYRWRGKSYPTRSSKQLADEERRLTSRAPKA